MRPQLSENLYGRRGAAYRIGAGISAGAAGCARNQYCFAERLFRHVRQRVEPENAAQHKGCNFCGNIMLILCVFQPSVPFPER